MNAAETEGGLLPACPNFSLEKVGPINPRYQCRWIKFHFNFTNNFIQDFC
jgi:hypothetical protein